MSSRGSRPLFATTAVAHANIALAKYWGKSNVSANLPSVPSLSLTLAALKTTTTVEFDESLQQDVFVLDGKPAEVGPTRRAVQLLDRVRTRSGLRAFARVESSNNFPTASGLASSASGFAALAFAALKASGTSATPPEVSRLARESSVSAARSAYGGLVTLAQSGREAMPLKATKSLNRLALVIAITKRGPKSVGSTEGMLLTQETSPYYRAWTESAPIVFEELRTALIQGDLQRAGEAMEHSTLLMHASMMAARPALFYWEPGTLAAMNCVRQLRRGGSLAYFTMDAGAHVKVLTERHQAPEIEKQLSQVPGVEQVIISGIGPGAHEVKSP